MAGWQGLMQESTPGLVLLSPPPPHPHLMSEHPPSPHIPFHTHLRHLSSANNPPQERQHRAQEPLQLSVLSLGRDVAPGPLAVELPPPQSLSALTHCQLLSVLCLALAVWLSHMYTSSSFSLLLAST